MSEYLIGKDMQQMREMLYNLSDRIQKIEDMIYHDSEKEETESDDTSQ
jgi:hypothetical protein